MASTKTAGRLIAVVLGTGSIGMQHLRTFQSLRDTKFFAVPVRSRRFSALRGAGFIICKDLPAAAKQGATLAIIATDTGRHIDDLDDALKAGMNVLVEKPISSTAARTAAIRRIARRASRLVFVGCVLRFSESLNQYRAWLPRLGAIHSVRIECQSYLPDWRPRRPYRNSYSARLNEGGVLRDLIHEIDYAGWLYGWPDALQARLKNLGRLGIKSEEIAELSWETASRTLVSINLDYLTRPPVRKMRALGERGILEWNGITQRVRFEPAKGKPMERVFSQTREEMFLAQAKAVVQACQGKADDRLASLDDGIKAIAICDTARFASANRCEERVKYP
jgi:predicted dehydrogenase